MNPRNGGNKIPEILKDATGVDLIKANIEASLGVEDLNLSYNCKEKYMSTYVLHSDRDGILKEIKCNESIKENLLEINMEKQIGDKVDKFNNAEKLLGILFLEFQSLEEMKYKLGHINELIYINVE